ncbi:MAG: MotA/TolQ/ExbB proton channel family protein [Pseudomonadota bacterium]|nr:MotA/TolQ/ExbB proton channel family protein [Pseudomonadota bacterium]
MAGDIANIEISTPSTGVDLASILGLVGGLGLIVAAILSGGSIGSFFNAPSLLIVVCGTVLVTMIAYPLKDFTKSPKIVAKSIFRHSFDPGEVGRQMIQLSEMARKEGPVSLEKILNQIGNDPFLHKAISLIADGTGAAEVEKVLTDELDSLVERHDRAASVLRRGAEVAPAMGLIGTLVGLVQMLANLDDPSSIGPAMAIALLTTFYGAILGNVVLAPLASKLENNSSHEKLVKSLTQIGAVSIAKQENPRRLEMLLNSLLPPVQRIQYFD